MTALVFFFLDCKVVLGHETPCGVSDMRLWQAEQVCCRFKESFTHAHVENAQECSRLKEVSDMRSLQHAQAIQHAQGLCIGSDAASPGRNTNPGHHFWAPTPKPCTLFGKAVSDFSRMHSRRQFARLVTRDCPTLPKNG